jgi:hypothetical protein
MQRPDDRTRGVLEEALQIHEARDPVKVEDISRGQLQADIFFESGSIVGKQFSIVRGCPSVRNRVELNLSVTQQAT